MSVRRSLQLPIILAVVMILLLAALTTGWVILAVRSALRSATSAAPYWAILSVGAVFFALVVAGVVVYLTLSIKAINLNQRQSNFIDSVTHELKSPIASLKLYLQTLVRRELSAQEQRQFYESMIDDLNRLDRLIDHLLDVARLDKPREKLPPEPIALDRLIEDCAATICARYSHQADAFELDLEPVTVVASRVDVELVLRNIIDNAAKYAGSPPRIEIRLRRVNDRAVITVCDNGRGIPKHLRHQVFGRFVRLGTELQRERPGTGLGLFIVKTMVRRLRGTIRIGSAPNGHGTSVTLTLPARTPPLEPPRDDAAGARGQIAVSEPTASEST